MVKLEIQVIEKGGKWCARVPAIPWVEATGETAQDAVEMAASLAVSTLANYQALGKPSFGAN